MFKTIYIYIYILLYLSLYMPRIYDEGDEVTLTEHGSNKKRMLVFAADVTFTEETGS